MSVFIIAEAGVNHNGSLKLAKLLVDAAKVAGADCIKFQTFIAENLISQSAPKAEYQKQTTGGSTSQLEMVKNLELTFSEFNDLYEYCKKCNIEFMSTGFDFDSIDFLADLGIKRWKIPSGEITNLPYLEKIASYMQPIILSTGMSTMEEVKAAVGAIRKVGNNDITVLHCTTEYPAPFAAINLKAMNTMGEVLQLPIGYSDHSKGIEVSIAAVALGAQVIEKHFTLDRDMEGPDHIASLEPAELKALVSSIRNVELSLGDGLKKPTISEYSNIHIVRKSLVAKKEIKAGDKFSVENITAKRPGSGISPMMWHEVLGKTAIRDFQADELIEI